MAAMTIKPANDHHSTINIGTLCQKFSHLPNDYEAAHRPVDDDNQHTFMITRKMEPAQIDRLDRSLYIVVREDS
jgi:hypothetical protein